MLAALRRMIEKYTYDLWSNLPTDSLLHGGHEQQSRRSCYQTFFFKFAGSPKSF